MRCMNYLARRRIRCLAQMAWMQKVSVQEFQLMLAPMSATLSARALALALALVLVLPRAPAW